MFPSHTYNTYACARAHARACTLYLCCVCLSLENNLRVANKWLEREGTAVSKGGFGIARARTSQNGIRRARAENSMFPSGFNAVLTDWQIPRLNGAKSFHQNAHARYISIAYFEYIAVLRQASDRLFTSAIYQRAGQIEDLTYHHRVAQWRMKLSWVILNALFVWHICRMEILGLISGDRAICVYMCDPTLRNGIIYRAQVAHTFEKREEV